MPSTKCLIHGLSHASCVKEWAKPSSLYIVIRGALTHSYSERILNQGFGALMIILNYEH
jgi:hypothetical protein